MAQRIRDVMTPKPQTFGTSTTLTNAARTDVVTVTPDDAAAKAVKIMRERAVRRLPVVEGDDIVGIVSIGDLAEERDSESALADISEEPPNR